MERTRAEHLEWCKQRAREYLPHDPQQAVASMVSDLRKHPETSELAQGILAVMALRSTGTPSDAQRYIEGFN